MISYIGTSLLFCCKSCVDPVVNMQSDTNKFQSQMLSYMQDLSSKFNQVILSLDKKVDKEDFEGLKGKVDDLEGKVDQCKTTVDSLQNKLDENKKEVENTMEAKCQEIKEDAQRDFNIIIYGIPEPEGTAEARQKEDSEKVQKTFEKLLPNQDVPVRKIYRLGKFDEEVNKPKAGAAEANGARPRPLKVVLYSIQQKDTLLRKIAENKKSNPNEQNHIQMTSDRSKKERENYRKLKAELDRRTQEGEQNLYIHGDKIVTRNPCDKQL